MFSGAFAGLLAAPLISLGKPNEVGERSGLMFTIVAFGAMCGPPISGAVRKASEGWEIVGIYAGKCKGASDEAKDLCGFVVQVRLLRFLCFSWPPRNGWSSELSSEERHNTNLRAHIHTVDHHNLHVNDGEWVVQSSVNK